MNCKWCAYAHHLEQRTRTIIQGARSVRSGWTETNGSANGVTVFGVLVKRPKLELTEQPEGEGS